MAEQIDRKRDLVLPPGTYAYMQDVTKGVVKIYTGPTVINPTAQEIPVRYDAKAATFRKCDTLEDALCKYVVIVEGYYGVLLNPDKKRTQPQDGSTQSGNDLDVGRKVVIPGPAMFALWPGQVADVVRGHHLRSNQYLLARVYNEDESRKNWSKAVIKTAEGSEEKVSATPPDLTVGKLLIIKGTDVSFYIPPTGITVVQEGQNYVREALTLERLEYAILVDESGDKRYEYGPNVVFPAPTELFMENSGSKKFRAIELNEIQGIHLKVIAPYDDHKAGDELFLTGKDTSIYYPREEHSAIKYDGKVKHFATAVPSGEARYVLSRMSGVIRKVEGPAMLLPDPRSEVIVRRVLSDKQCALWYPGNGDALAYNQGLQKMMANAPTIIGTLRDGDVKRESKTRTSSLLANSSGSPFATGFGDASFVSRDQGFVGDEFARAAQYTQPRTLTIDSKYQGVPVVEVWTGYAVMRVAKSGARSVDIGPKSVLLDYDEALETIGGSVYLRVENSIISDTFVVETMDHVAIEVRLSYRLNFVGDSSKWFSVENYSNYLKDHIRSLVKGEVRKLPVTTFHADSTGLLRTMTLIDHKFTNGMQIADVEVNDVGIVDPSVRQLFERSQTSAVQSHIEQVNIERDVIMLGIRNDAERERDRLVAETARLKAELEEAKVASQLQLALSQLTAVVSEQASRKEAQQATEDVANLQIEAQLGRERQKEEQRLAFRLSEQGQRIALLRAESEAAVQRFAAVQGGFSEALLALSNNETMQKVAEAWSIQRVIGGESVSDALAKVFAGSPLAGLVQRMTALPTSKNGSHVEIGA